MIRETRLDPRPCAAYPIRSRTVCQGSNEPNRLPGICRNTLSFVSLPNKPNSRKSIRFRPKVDRARRGPGNPVRNPELTRSGRDVRDDRDATGPQPGKAVVSIASEPEDLSTPRRAMRERRPQRPRDSGRADNGASPWHAPPSSGSPGSAQSRAEACAGGALGRPHRPPSWRRRAGLRAASWERARAAGIDVIPSGDFSLYDHVLDTAWAVGAIPDRFGGPDADGLDAYFAMARGTAGARPLEMTKWFDTNYHYLVPELAPRARPSALRAEHWLEPLARGARARHRDAPGGARAGDLPAAVEGPRPAARRARRAGAGVRRAAARAGRGGRARGAARRAVPGARPHGGGARRDRRRDRRAGGRGRRRALPGDLLRRARRRARAGPRRCRWRRSTSTSSARRTSSSRRSTRWPAARRGCRSACVDGRNVWAADLDAALARSSTARPPRSATSA